MKALSCLALTAAFCGLLSAQTESRLPADVDPASYSRLPLVTRDQLDVEGQRVFDYVMGKDKTAASVGPATTSLYSPGVAEPMQHLNQYLRQTVVGRPFFEISALIAAWEFEQTYEWSSHETGALRAGVSQNVIDAIKYNRNLKGLPEKEATVIQFGRDLFRAHKVSPRLYAKVVQLFGRQGTVELTAIMGDYAMAAVMLNAVDQQLTPDRKPLLPSRR